MREGSQYLQHAEECRALATQLTGEARAQLLRMAETWEALHRRHAQGSAVDADGTASPSA